MSKLTRNNLQLFCRTCLSALRPGVASSFDIHLFPDLTKLLIIFTTLDVNEDNEVYPKELCQHCFDKLQDIQSFRYKAIESTEKLRKIINGQEIVDEKFGRKCKVSVAKIKRTKYENKKDDDDIDDNQMLLPEILSTASFCEISINTASKEINDKTLEAESDLNKHAAEIKKGINSEIEELNAINENDEILRFYESSEDELDENEKEVQYGSVDGSIDKLAIGLKSASKRKRDRRKNALKCHLCDKKVYKQVYLDAHIRAVHEGHEKPFLCVHCHKSYKRFNKLHMHMHSTHLKDENSPCEYEGCDIKLNTLDKNEKVAIAESIAANSKTCHQCSKMFSSRRTLAEHLKRHANIKEHICQECGVAKVTRPELLTHMRTHQPNAEKFKCYICPQEFNHKNAIKRHVRVVHDGERSFACSYCPKKLSTRYSKLYHERLHAGERPFLCEMCNKRFAQSEGLKRHMKTHDKSLRTHVCRFCYQRFITSKDLNDHEQRHIGSKPHICEFCGRGFFQREDMLRHREIHEEFLEKHEIRDRDDSNAWEMADNESSQNGK